ncbi:MAG: ABC transporter permease [Desulfohalobiaceae bacterium]
MRHGSSLTLAPRLARREMRSGLKSFGVFLACLFLGVFAISAVGSFAAAARSGLLADARSLLGGDVEVTLTHRALTPEQSSFIERFGRIATVVEMRAMARPDNDSPPLLVELKAVDESYPLFGQLTLDPGLSHQAMTSLQNGAYGAAADPLLLDRLEIELGGRLRLGDAVYEIRSLISNEPDRGLEAFTIGPRLLVGLNSLEATGLVTPASLIKYRYRIDLHNRTSPAGFIRNLTERFPDAGWRVRPYTEASPRIRALLDRLSSSLTLVGLAALLLGGVGISGAVRGFLDSRTLHIATMKCLGASGGMVFSIYLCQILILGAAGSVLGCAVGAATPYVLKSLFATVLPVPLKPGLHAGTLLTAAAFGMFTALLFSLKSLGAAGNVPPAVLFRGYLESKPHRATGVTMVLMLTCGLSLVILALLTSEDQRLAAWFLSGTALSFLAFFLLSRTMIAVTRRLPRPNRVSLQLALTNIPRPGSPAPSLVFSLGLGLTALCTVGLVQGNLASYVDQNLPEQAPAFYFIDIQSDQLGPFTSMMSTHPEVQRVQSTPTLRGRITAINGVPVEKADIDPGVAWAVRGDRALTSANRPDTATEITAGEWWPADYDGPPLLSLTTDLAQGFGVTIGDTLTLNILGRDVTATIANLREVDWSTMQMQFAIILAPGPLERLPRTHLASVHSTPGSEGAILRQVTEAFPNVTVVRVKEVLENVSSLLRRLGAVFTGLAAIVLLAGFLVLAGAVSADQHRRIYDAVIFKVCGATRRDILTALCAEFGIVGCVTGLLSGLLASIAAWAVVSRVMLLDYQPMWGRLLLTLGAGLAFAVIFGLAGTARSLGRRASAYLRNE